VKVYGLIFVLFLVLCDKLLTINACIWLLLLQYCTYIVCCLWFREISVQISNWYTFNAAFCL